MLSRYAQRRGAARGDWSDVERERQPTSIDRIAAGPEPPTPDLRGLTSPDGAITLMLSDIADADSLAQQIGPERWEQLLRDHRKLVEEAVTYYGGQVAKFDQDGFFASFHSAHGGLLSAVALQRRFPDVAAGVGNALALRIGLHSGFVIAAPDQPQGRNMVLAARIAGQARAGEILVSSSLREYTERDPSFSFEPRGEHHFKGLVGEHEIY